MATNTIVKYRTPPQLKKKRRRANRFTLPLGVIIPMSILGIDTVQNIPKIGAKNSMAVLGRQLTGFDSRDRKFHLDGLMSGMVPILAGMFAHKIAGKIGINRALSSAGVPWIRV